MEQKWGKIFCVYTKGKTLQRLQLYAAAGSDARMGGSVLPVVANCGSGNQGITIAVPISIYAEKKGKSRDVLYRAMIFANLISIYINVESESCQPTVEQSTPDVPQSVESRIWTRHHGL